MRRVALCVGVDYYDAEEYASLAHAVEDAERICSLLKNLPPSARFDALFLANPTAAEVKKRLRKLTEELDEDSFFFFYFAGHGTRLVGDAGQSLLCRDASARLSSGSSKGAIEPLALQMISSSCRAKKFFCFDTGRSAAYAGSIVAATQSGVQATCESAVFPSAALGKTGVGWALSSTRDGALGHDDGVFASALESVIRAAVDKGEEVALGEEFVGRVAARMEELGSVGQAPAAFGTPFALISGTGVSLPQTPLQLTKKAQVALDSGRLDDAERLANAALALDSRFEWAKFVLTETEKERERIRDEERRRLELDQLLNEGWRLLNVGDSKSALLNADVVLQGRPNDPAALELKRKAESAVSASEPAREASEPRVTDIPVRNDDSENAASQPEPKPETREDDSDSSWSQSITRKAGERRTLTINGVEYGFRWIPAGSFVMGSSASEQETAQKCAAASRKDLSPAREEYEKMKDSPEFKMMKDLVKMKRMFKQGELDLSEMPEEDLNRVEEYWESDEFKEIEFWITLDELIDPISTDERSLRSFEDEILHKVNFSRGLWMLETATTQEMWTSVMGENPSSFTDTKRLPAENISWNDCQSYIEKLNGLGVCPEGYEFSLPTEAEWEYACRAGTTTAYYFGDMLDGDNANCDGRFPYPCGTKPGPILEQTSPVKMYLPPNPWGLYDMHGNVAEWVQDRYGDYPTGEVTDPTGPTEGSSRVVRGGSWVEDAVYCRAACRGGELEPDQSDSYIGVRLVLRMKER